MKHPRIDLSIRAALLLMAALLLRGTVLAAAKRDDAAAAVSGRWDRRCPGSPGRRAAHDPARRGPAGPARLWPVGLLRHRARALRRRGDRRHAQRRPGRQLHPGPPDRQGAREERRGRRHERQPGVPRRPAGRRGGVQLAVHQRGDRGHHADRVDAAALRPEADCPSRRRLRPSISRTSSPAACPRICWRAQFARLQPRFANGAAPAVQWATAGFGEQSQGMLRQALGSVSSSGKAAPGTVPDDLAPGKRGGRGAGGRRLPARRQRHGDRPLRRPGARLRPSLPGARAGPGADGDGRGGDRPLEPEQLVQDLQHSARSSAPSSRTARRASRGGSASTAPMIPMVAAGQGRASAARVPHAAGGRCPSSCPLLVGSTRGRGPRVRELHGGLAEPRPDGPLRASRGYGDLVMRQSFDGDSAACEAAAFLLAIAAYLSQNPLEKVDARETSRSSSRRPQQPRVATLVGANASRTVVRPGDRVDAEPRLRGLPGRPLPPLAARSTCRRTCRPAAIRCWWATARASTPPGWPWSRPSR